MDYQMTPEGAARQYTVDCPNDSLASCISPDFQYWPFDPKSVTPVTRVKEYICTKTEL